MKDLGIIRSGVEFITLPLIEKIERYRKMYAQVAIGVYTDELFQKLLGRQPIKPLEERLKLANSIKGVDWVFKASNQDEVQMACMQLYKPSEGPHEIRIGYIPGTWDLLHEGHLQHLLMGSELCDILVVGVNSDELVWENKQVKTHDSQEKRVMIIKNLKFVDLVLLAETNDKSVINGMVLEQLGAPIDAIILGSDLKGQNHDTHGIPVVYTARDEEFMKTHSSTYLRKIMSDFLGESTE